MSDPLVFSPCIFLATHTYIMLILLMQWCLLQNWLHFIEIHSLHLQFFIVVLVEIEPRSHGCESELTVALYDYMYMNTIALSSLLLLFAVIYMSVADSLVYPHYFTYLHS